VKGESSFQHSERGQPKRKIRVKIRSLTFPATKLGRDMTFWSCTSNLVLVDDQLQSQSL
jgi:hypothetical protein